MRRQVVGSLVVSLVTLAAFGCATPEPEGGTLVELPTMYGVPVRNVKAIAGKWDGRYYGGRGNATVHVTINADGSYQAVTSTGRTYHGQLTVISRPQGAAGGPVTYAMVAGENDGSIKWEDEETTGTMFLHEGGGKRLLTGGGNTRDGRNAFNVEYWPAKD